MMKSEEFQKLVLKALAHLIASQTRVLNKAKFHANSGEEAQDIGKEIAQLEKRYDTLSAMLESFEK